MSPYSYLFGFIIACLSYIFYYNYVNVKSSIVSKPNKRYDYIIVGAGTAGCVLAARLSENPKIRVLLVEAGEQMSFFTKIPLTVTSLQRGPYDWSVRTTPQKYSSFGLYNQTQFIPRGKGLGGSGEINFLMHGFGLPKDFKTWQNKGMKSWAFEELKSYFLKAFGTTNSQFDSGFCDSKGKCVGSKAPMILTQLSERNDLMQVFKEASSYKTSKGVLFRKPTATVDSGARVSTLQAYLKPVLNRKNLHVLLKTTAISIRFKNKKASSLYILQNGRHFDNIFINKEIILSAGTIKTPQILMLSGIGPSKVLEKLKISPVVINEYVGRNVHDHMNMPIYVSIKKPISVTLSKIFTFQTLWDYLWNGKGPLSFPPLAGIEYFDDSALMLFALGTANERLLRDVSNYKSKVFRETFRYHNRSSSKEGFIFLATCANPQSRGWIKVNNVSAISQPLVNPNYLHRYEDVECIMKAIRRAERLVSSKPFRDIGAFIHWPRPERCLTFWTRRNKKGNRIKGSSSTHQRDSPSQAFIECIIREVAVTGHHIGGSCSGGTVVDQFFRLKSVSGLRLVDASILPSPISLYPNSVIIALAEKAADIIKK